MGHLTDVHGATAAARAPTLARACFNLHQLAVKQRTVLSEHGLTGLSFMVVGFGSSCGPSASSSGCGSGG